MNRNTPRIKDNNVNMSFDLPSVDELKRAAECGQRITPEDVSVISQAESELTGSGPIQGGPAGLSLILFYCIFRERMNILLIGADVDLDVYSNRPKSRNETNEFRHQN